MSKITLEFDLTELQTYSDPDIGMYEIESVEGAIVSAAARKLLSDYSGKIDKAITSEINRILTSGIEERVRERVDAMVADAFNSDYHVVNSFGRPTDKVTSIAAQVEQMIERIFNEKVNSNGQRIDDNYGRREAKARWEWHVEKILTEAIDRELQKHIRNVVDEAKNQAKKRIADKLIGELG